LEAIFPPDCPAQFKLVAKKSVEYYPKDRPSFKEILKDLKALRTQLSGGPPSPTTERINIDWDEVTAEGGDHAERGPCADGAEEERSEKERDDDRGPEIDIDDYNRSDREREDERGPEICFDEDERTEGDRENDRGPEIRLDDPPSTQRSDEWEVPQVRRKHARAVRWGSTPIIRTEIERKYTDQGQK
jgi:hypothetical protein